MHPEAAFMLDESGYISLDRTINQGVENNPTNVNVHGQEIVSGGLPRRNSPKIAPRVDVRLPGSACQGGNGGKRRRCMSQGLQRVGGRRGRWCQFLALFAFIVLAAPTAPALAQLDTGTIRGTVKDSSGG